jgi:hypothetical protein
MEWFADLFKPLGLNHLALFSKLFCAVFAVQLALNFSEQYQYFLTRPEKIYGGPPKLLGILRIPPPGRVLFLFSGGILLISLCAVTAGVFPRFFVLIALLCYFFYFMPIMSLAHIQRKTNLLPLVLLIFLISPSTGRPIHAPGTAWELTLVKVAIAQLYFSAGLQKVRNSGLNWINGKTLQAYLLENYLWSDQKAGLQLALKPQLCMLASILVLFFELSFWIIIPVPALTPVYVTGAVLFHIGTLVAMRINYLKYLLPVYTVFLTNIVFKLLA